MEYLRKLTEPEFYYEEYKLNSGNVDTMIRAYFPDGTSQFLSLNRYNDYETIIPHIYEWYDSHDNDWHPDNRYAQLNHVFIRVG